MSGSGDGERREEVRESRAHAPATAWGALVLLVALAPRAVAAAALLLFSLPCGRVSRRA
jgi:hypothetical protein